MRIRFIKSRRCRFGLALLALAGLLAYFLYASRTEFPVQIQSGRGINLPRLAPPISDVGGALILAPDGTIWGWGRNAGTFGPWDAPSQLRSPRRLPVGSNWVSLASGLSFALGIKSDGSLWGWSFDTWFAIGSYTNPPTQLVPGTNWVSVAAGSGNSFALRGDGSLWGWGWNEFGQVGNGSTNVIQTPVQIGTNYNWRAIAAGGTSSIGLQEDGSLWQWGWLDSNSREPLVKRVPTRCGSGTNWAAILESRWCFTVRHSDGSLWILGRAYRYGGTNELEPFPLNIGTQYLAAASGSSHLLFVKSDGTLWSAGEDPNGGAGPEDQPPVNGLRRIGQRSDWRAVWATDCTSFGQTKDGTIWTWGAPMPEPSAMAVLDFNIRSWLGRYGVVREPQWPKITIPWALVSFTTNRVPTRP